MSDYIKKLENMKKQGENPKIKNKSPSSNQIQKLKHENKELNEKYDRLKQHELSEANIIQYFLGIRKTKLYELARFFDMNAAHEIENLLKKLLKEKKIYRGKNNWLSINPDYKKQVRGLQ